MSSNDEVDIGFDPLAWMNDEQENDPPPKDSEPAAQKNGAQTAVAEEPSTEIKGEEEVTVVQSAQFKTTESHGITIDLAGKMDIASAAELKQELSAVLDQSGPITFTAADVARADGAGLQLLTAFVRELDGAGRELAWEAPSEQLIDAAHIVGLKEALHLP